MKFYQQFISQAMVAQAEGDDKAAEAFFKEALDEAEKVDPDGPRVAEACNYLGAFYQQEGRAAEAIAMVERATAIYERHMEGEGAELKSFYLMLASLHEDNDDEAGAQVWKDKARHA